MTIDEKDSSDVETLEPPSASDDFCKIPELPFNPKDVNIAVEPQSLFSLINRIRFAEIDMNTDFQRHADLWNDVQMSRLIESILIRLPLPPFYFDISNDSCWLIVDGLQRLSTIRKFVVEKTLILKGLEFLVDLNGQTYDHLSRMYQRRIDECPITTYLIQPGTPQDVKYSIFKRINTGGLTLNHQEIRNTLTTPRVRTLLQSLAENVTFKLLIGDLSKRMVDQELVLRFWAFYKFDKVSETPRKKTLSLFLDQTIEELRKADESVYEELSLSFLCGLSRSYLLLGENAFQNNNKLPTVNSILFETWMVILVRLSESSFQTLLEKKEMVKEKISSVIDKEDFHILIRLTSQQVQDTHRRLEKLTQRIQETLNA